MDDSSCQLVPVLSNPATVAALAPFAVVAGALASASLFFTFRVLVLVFGIGFLWPTRPKPAPKQKKGWIPFLGKPENEATRFKQQAKMLEQEKHALRNEAHKAFQQVTILEKTVQALEKELADTKRVSEEDAKKLTEIRHYAEKMEKQLVEIVDELDRIYRNAGKPGATAAGTSPEQIDKLKEILNAYSTAVAKKT